LFQPFQLALARRKLRLQFRPGLLAFGGAGNGLAHVNDAEFSFPWPILARCLCACSALAPKTQAAAKSAT